MRSRMVGLAASAVLVAAPACAQKSYTPPPAELVEQARRVLAETPVIDGHNDLVYMMLEKGGTPEDTDLRAAMPGYHTDLPRLRAGRVGAQFWSAYVPVDSLMETGAATRHGLRTVDMVHRLDRKYDDLELARTAADIERIEAAGRIASLIGLEGGHALGNSLSTLRAFYDLGVRYLTLTHSANTDWADASTDTAEFGGLNPLGEEIVREMNRLGMFVDISHVSAETMLDALRITEAPVIFSHSSARALLDHPRNVPDEVLKLMPANGGVVMVNFCPCFIAPDYPAWREAEAAEIRRLRNAGTPRAEFRTAMDSWVRENPPPRGTLQDVADHIDHIRDVAGIGHIGIGSDFDGIDFTPVGLDDVSAFPALFAELLRRGYSEAELRKIAGENLIRAMKQMESVAARLRTERAPSDGVPSGR